MGEPTMAERVEKLEKTVGSLAALPGEVRAVGRRLVRVELRAGAIESQIVHLQSEMHGEFSAVRDQLAQAKTDLLEVIDSSSRATQLMFDDVSKRLDRVEARLGGLEAAVAGMATAAEMRQLHRELVRQIATLGSGRELS